MKKLLLLAMAVVLVGCGTLRKENLEAYQRQLQEIEQAHKNGDISKGEYLKMKHDAENAYRRAEDARKQRAATILYGD